jgi:riboflavin kinase/FMN adenylyltransferase
LEIISESVDFQLNRETAIAIGKFDGVHVGHRRLLEEILEKKKDGLEACVFTFDVSPAVLFGLSDGKVLTTRREKRKIFEGLGVDVLVEFSMNLTTAAIPAEEFARKYLSGALCGRFIAAGEDLSFGQYGKGNAELLRRLSGELAFEVRTIPKVSVDGVQVSSTYVRSLLEQGKMEEVTRFLGEPFFFHGVVTHGRHLGHTLGFPTLNLLPEEEKLLPPFGVYFSKVRIDGRLHPAITNIGRRPTVSAAEPGKVQKLGEAAQAVKQELPVTHVSVETYLYDFDGDLYEKEITVYLHHFHRPEQKFESLDALKAQIALDVAAGKE